jgi:hypothetical protein
MLLVERRQISQELIGNWWVRALGIIWRATFGPRAVSCKLVNCGINQRVEVVR